MGWKIIEIGEKPMILMVVEAQGIGWNNSTSRSETTPVTLFCAI